MQMWLYYSVLFRIEIIKDDKDFRFEREEREREKKKKTLETFPLTIHQSSSLLL